MSLTERQQALCDDSPHDYSDLSALFLNCTLKPSPERSHTELLLQVPTEILEKQGVTVEHVRAVDLDLAPGVQPDMREHGFETDDWPALYEQVEAADILIVGTPIWLGEKSSVCSRLIERLYAMSGLLNDAGQYAYYGKVGGCIVTGNEDGIKHVAMTTGFALNHLGYTIPPQADCGWIGEAGPGPSFGDELEDGRAGFDNDFTRRNTTIMTWNLMHCAAMLRAAGGYPASGNDRNALGEGARFGFEYPGTGGNG